MSKNRDNNDEMMRASPEFLAWLQTIKIHPRQSNREILDDLMQVCKQKGVLEAK
jgi:hypothetical protein